jgi:hypothetical protein
VNSANNNLASGNLISDPSECAAGTAGMDVINFDGSVFNVDKTIDAGSDLPPISSPVRILGSASQWIKVRGPGGSSEGFVFNPGSAGSTLDRLILNQWSTAVDLEGGSVTVTRSRFGLDFDGTAVEPNDFPIQINSSNNRIGGLDAFSNSMGNVLSNSNGDGLVVASGTNNVIQANFIGTDPTGLQTRGNTGSGVSVNGAAVKTTIGGMKPGQGNVIANGTSGDMAGVEVGQGAKSTRIMRNFFGIGADGTTDLNSGLGVDVFDQGGLGTVIGGPMPAASNFLDNADDGIELDDLSHLGKVTIMGNIFGRDGGDTSAGNGAGILFSSPPLLTTIKGNLIEENNYGMEFGTNNPAVSVTQNCIQYNGTAGAYSLSSTIDLHANWWGASTGPNTPGADQTGGSFTVSPWLTKAPTSCMGWAPKMVNPKNNSVLAAKMSPTVLSWSGVPTASSYNVELDQVGLGSIGFWPGLTSHSHPSNAPLGYAAYSYFLNVHNSEGISWPLPNGPYTFYVTIQKYPKPAQVLPSSVSPNGILFSWAAYPGAITYTLYYAVTTDCTSPNVVPSISGTSFAPITSWSTGQHSWQVQPNNGPLMPCQPFTVAP